MFDSLSSDFKITEIVRHNDGAWDDIPVVSSAQYGVGMLLNYKLLPSDKVQIKVSDSLP